MMPVLEPLIGPIKRNHDDRKLVESVSEGFLTKRRDKLILQRDGNGRYHCTNVG